MKTRLPYFFIVSLLLLSAYTVKGQNKRLISGVIRDAATKEVLPFVTVSLKAKMIGVVSNEEGKFELYVPAELISDTLLVNYLGYKHFLLALSNITSTVDIALEQTVVQLEEIVIKAISPEEYVLMAMRKVKQNYAQEPFETTAYYRERILENKNMINSKEGIFKTYYTSYSADTMSTQNQLLLLREEKHPERINFGKRYINRGDTTDTIPPAPSKNVALIFGGPGEVLKSGNMTKDPETFLDTTKLKKHVYSFAKSSSYNTDGLVVINFATKGKVEKVRQSGKIYIDLATLAIVKVESAGDAFTPGALKFIFFLFSIGVKNPSFESQLEFEKRNEKWYPKNIENKIRIRVTNNHVFKKDEKADVEIEQYFIVNELNISNPAEIALEKRFNEKKGMDGQVHNDSGISWEGLNIIKK